MKRIAIFVVCFSCTPSAYAQQTEHNESAKQPSSSSYGSATTEYTTATGRPLGSVTVIGETTYFTGADGTPLGTATTVDGHKVYRSY